MFSITTRCAELNLGKKIFLNEFLETRGSFRIEFFFDEKGLIERCFLTRFVKYILIFFTCNALFFSYPKTSFSIVDLNLIWTKSLSFHYEGSRANNFQLLFTKFSFVIGLSIRVSKRLARRESGRVEYTKETNGWMAVFFASSITESK